MSFVKSGAAGFALALALLSPALADRQYSAAELAGLEASLHARGFDSWERVKLKDDGEWEVEKARAADGQTYDLKLDYETLEITHSDRNIIQWNWDWDRPFTSMKSNLFPWD